MNTQPNDSVTEQNINSAIPEITIELVANKIEAEIYAGEQSPQLICSLQFLNGDTVSGMHELMDGEDLAIKRRKELAKENALNNEINLLKQKINIKVGEITSLATFKVGLN